MPATPTAATPSPINENETRSKIDDDHVHVDQTRERVAGSPAYDPDLAYEQDYYGGLSGYYGYAPYWGAGYVYPGYPYYA